MQSRFRRSTLVVSLALLALTTTAGAQNWPSFRGEHARGIADGQDLPIHWDIEPRRNLRWSTPIPGMGHSSPVIWGDRIFLTTAVADAIPDIMLGDKGGIDVVREAATHSWRLYCLDKSSGAIRWWKEAYAGVPRVARHVKASQANSTPATDGEIVAAIFGSEGLAVFDLDGTLRWQADLGPLDAGLFGDPTSHWGHSSSPVIFEHLIIVQVDRHRDSYLTAFDARSGKRVWTVSRDEKPTWATPTLHRTGDSSQLIVVGGDYDRGYDPETGHELWRFARDYEVKTPTPIVADGLVILAGGYRGKPLFALRAETAGDASLAAGAANNSMVAWTSEPGGPYTSTPIAYRGRLYFVRNTGIVNALELATGERLFRERLEGNYSASPVASDGKIYFAAEEGLVSVLAAGSAFEVLAQNDMREPCMATPAISDGTLFLRTRTRLYAIGDRAAAGAASSH